MSQVKFFKCAHCGKIIGVIAGPAEVPTICCGEPMAELVANIVDAASEKHVPVISVDGNLVTVKVGDVAHPMEEDHYITFIYLKTEKGGQRKPLNPGEEPVAVFALTDDDKAVAAYEYCNKHGLWMAEA